MKKLKRIAFILMLTAGIASLAACNKDRNSASNTGTGTTNEVTDGTKDNNVIGGAAEDIKDGVEDAGDAIKDAVDGSDNATGTNGTSGTNNAAGTNGTTGTDNVAGTNGTTGTDGATGLNGSTGAGGTNDTAMNNNTTTDNNNR